MSTISVDLDDEVIALLRKAAQPVPQAVREIVVLELYRRGTISSGKGAQLLGLSRRQFLTRAAQMGIPHFDMTDDEWARERALSDTL